jgi:glycosyltransferase involved in cell wall biosynthesis
MIKIFLANESKQTLGGGFTFLRNFRRIFEFKMTGVIFVDDWREADIYFISSATMISRDEVEAVWAMGKKIVLRIDNIPKNSRNRNTGTSRLYDFAKAANLLIFQSQWAKEYVSLWLPWAGNWNVAVILNGTDEKIFNPDGPKAEKDGEPQYLYVRFNRDETKRWDEAWYEFQRISLKNQAAHLWIVGNFSDELKEYSFDFFGGAENRFKYLGIIDNQEEMARIYRSADNILIPYFNDACSNVLLEALACGCSPEFLRSGYTGGAPEIMGLDDLSLERMGREYLEQFEKLLAG